ncbi:CAP domain-containing protein [Coniochaeta sp. 2T2.1]|nr:CAP domain-containing protein [Coniochaeta sp. 2T2.1]
MKTSMFLAASGAIMAMATPLNMQKRKMETKVVIEWQTVTVTEGANPTFVAAGVHHFNPPVTSEIPTTPTPEPVTVAAPDPTTEEPVVVTTAPEPKVEPTVEAAPAPAPIVETPEAAPAQAPAAASVPEAPAADPTDYASIAVAHHNYHRLNHSAPAISYSTELAGYAAETAAKCKFAHDKIPGGGNYGQNLAVWASSGDVRAELSQEKAIAQAVTDMWYNGELNLFPEGDYGKDNPDMTNFEGFGHFTQVVWVGSETVGCHTQYCDAGTIYDTMGSVLTVCNYGPSGNMGGGYGKNVLRPLGQATVTV